ncbi:DNA-3-methyladenine glycosylase [Chryseobacterium chendengshani]|uniref:DNA-3-methyladenine glycosylase n=1 Tax=Chryseobacterium sp. LJ668 TaxID=2864040 RepID=UPI001C68FDE6|nr:DNA-3-methyladenine glycosylase [Chryseobacterium sp. LJ668]MBW8522901.1 DNA-3-methyladenine glycosylase [Chryseobacterium sp. LJ668]QYK16430.1 DNA-3-methyladenine glycosylase [Chryseobacterium sp. LJ668]
MKLPRSYYHHTDAAFLAKDLLGKVLLTCKDGNLTAGIIVETEAYFGVDDKASHAFGGKRTSRTEAMYQEGGTAYVYLCYGIHHLLNIVTSVENDPKCVLIRGIEPLIGLEFMEIRRKMKATRKEISSGPGSVAKALGIDSSFNQKIFTGDEIYIEDHGISYESSQISTAARIGISYAQEHADLPLRFYVADSKYAKKHNLN